MWKVEKMAKAIKYEVAEFDEIPNTVAESEVLYLLQTKSVDWSVINQLKQYASRQDEVVSNWLNISVRTLRNYKTHATRIKENLKEHIIMLFALFKHGTDVFGTTDAFNAWLNKENFHFDGKSPSVFLNTITGIRFVDRRLTAMEFGDNV